jgi:glutamate carboxypeptidase
MNMDFNQYFRSRQGEMIGLLKELVVRESPSSDKKAVDACSSFLAEQFRRLGAKTTRFAQKKIGDLHLFEYPGREDKALDGRLLVLTHIDTVWPVGRIEKMPFYLAGEKLFGPGVLDMKAGIVLACTALRAMTDLNLKPRRRIAVFVNAAEEIGSDEAHKAIEDLARRSDAVLCLEPAIPGGALKVQRKGCLVVRLEATGRAAHGGTPERGVNAVEEIMAQLRRVQALKSKDVSVNIGMIGGGEKANVVPDKAWAVCDIRIWDTAHKEKVMAAVKKLVPSLRGAKIKASLTSYTPPMEKTKASTRLFGEAKEIAAGLGLALEGGKAGGGSDASIAAGLGRPTLDGLGPDGDGMHAENEHLLLPSFVQRAALITELFRRL